MLHRAATSLTLTLLAACRPAPAPTPPETPSPVESPREPPASTSSKTIPSRPGIVVADASGLHLHEQDGTRTATLSKTPAVAPRWLPDNETLVFIARDGSLRSLDRLGHERFLADLSTGLPCPAEAYPDGIDPDVTLALSMDEEFWISSDGTHACITLSDAFPNMRSVQRDFEVRLVDGALLQRAGGEGCGVRDTVEQLEHCATMPPTWSGDPTEIQSPIPGGEADSTSPDGAWTLVLVSSTLADLLHLQYVLVRNDDGAVFPLPTRSGPWPKAVTLATPVDIDVFLPELPEVIGGETIRWVGPHHLVVDQVLHVAGERVVDLGGDIAP